MVPFCGNISCGSVNAVSGGQVEAAADLGLSPWQIFTFIVWPQMLARIQPLIGQSVILVKESSVLSIITVGELTNTADHC
jgi:polar amino acid transport system permease protein